MDPDWPDIKDQIRAINHSIKEPACLIHLGDVGDPSYIKKLSGVLKNIMSLHGSTIERTRERNDYFKENIQ